MCEIFATSEGYASFIEKHCRKCTHKNCPTLTKINESCWKNGYDFPTDKIKRNKKTYEWECKDFEKGANDG